jgi:hypothetical protein
MSSKAIIKRRSLLKRLGAASFLAVPVFRETLLEAAAAPNVVRFVPIMLPGGATVGKFTWDGVLAPLAPFKGDAIEIVRMNNHAAGALHAVSGEPHGAALRTIFTCDSSVKAKDNASVFAKSDSIDQMIGEKIGSQLKFTTLQFGVATETSANPLDQKRMSFKAGVPQPPVESPTAMFTRLFGAGVPATQPPMSAPQPPASDGTADGKSMLDRLAAEVAALKAVAGGVRTPGSTMSPGQSVGLGCSPAAPKDVCSAQRCGPDIPTVTRQQFQLLHQALACDLTRTASMQLLGTAHTGISYPWLGVNDDHHGLEHNQDEGSGPALDKVQTFFAGEVAAFLGLLKQTREGDATMLDNTLVMFVSEFRNAFEHNHDDFPAILFGRAGGKVRPGRVIDYKDSGHGGWLRSVVNVFGIDRVVGDATNDPVIALG